jgi:serine/threonine-protein kinase
LQLRAQPGQQVGPYQLLFLLGEGGMGQVWAATRGGGRPVALKLMLTGELSPKVEALFLDEARISTALHHPSLVSTFERGIEGQTIYIAMELVSGPPISHLIDRLRERARTCPGEVLAHVIQCVARGLHHAFVEARADGRRLALVHRDVSPHNILVDGGGRVLLSDFGVARTAIQAHHTMRGEIRGKPEYMSPEQVAEEPLDHRSDLFSLGTVIYELATLERVFKRGSMMHSMLAVSQDDVPPLAGRRPDLPGGLTQLVDRMLVKNRDHRIQSAAEIERAVLDLRAELGWSDPRDAIRSLLAELFAPHELDVELRIGGPRKRSTSRAHNTPIHSRTVERPLAPPVRPFPVMHLAVIGILSAVSIGLGLYLFAGGPPPPMIEVVEEPPVAERPPPPPLEPPRDVRALVATDDLARAARKGTVEELRALLDRGGDPNGLDALLGWSPIHAAAQAGRADTVALLLDRGATIDLPAKDTGATALHLAARSGHLEVIDVLLARGASLASKDLSGDTALHAAVSDPSASDRPIVERLIGRGADLESHGHQDHTPLIRAAIQNHVEGAAALLDARAKIEATGAKGTALWHAAAHGRPDIVRLLLARGAKQRPNEDGVRWRPRDGAFTPTWWPSSIGARRSAPRGGSGAPTSVAPRRGRTSRSRGRTRTPS